MRKRRSQLVEEATLVSRELMRVAITPHELWHDGLEKAAQQYMEARDLSGMLETLAGGTGVVCVCCLRIYMCVCGCLDG